MHKGSAVLALYAALAATSAEAKWLRAETDSFIIYSEGNEKSLREFATTLQRFDVTLRLLLNVKEQGEPHRLPIYLLDSREDVAKLSTGSSAGSISGFYSAGSDGSYAVSYRGGDGMSSGPPASQETLFHEYAHHFMKRYRTAAFPSWLIEGFAEYYSTVVFNKDGKAEIGRPAYGRGHGLVRMPQIPADTLLNSDPFSLKTNEQVNVYYGRAWLLTHMLFHDPDRAGQLDAYIRAVNAGTDAKQAAIDSFGAYEQLDKDLAAYIRRPLLYRATKDAIPSPAVVAVAPVTAGEDASIPLRLERLNRRGDPSERMAVRDRIKALTTTHPSDPAVWFEYAAAEWGLAEDVRDLAAVRAALDKAIAAKPDHVRANLLLAELLMHELDEKEDYRTVSWSAPRSLIQLANRADPDDPLPLYAYYRSFVNQRMRPPAIAVQGLQQAFALAPENIEIRVSYAFALANQGSFDAAIRLAQSVAFDPHIGAQGRSLLARLEAMRDSRTGRPASSAPEAPDAAGSDE